ncbi:hypothetical protein QBZ16_003102 [Prototheca wickerhamii]|uniref:TPX2 central domain-containing protein n=1 Tax=Prototheca wickerhamii TaxID=3111 RepID=A0AAD9MNR7_PROWI|nr:hypothetical protein QBZ16_003102 [Prototheca wickerhamii]
MTDPRFEFDAPRYYDFARGSPESGSRPDDWFSDARATAGLKSPPDSEKAEPDENAPPADAPHKSTAAQSLHGKLVAAQSSAPAPRPVLAPIENAVLSRAASTEDSYHRPRLHAMRTRSLSKETLESKATVVPSSPWRSRAERIAEFEGRLQTRPRRANATHAGAQDFQTAGPDRAPGLLTLPHSPALQTRKRTRPARFKSREEVEAEEMAAMPPFKARPFR